MAQFLADYSAKDTFPASSVLTGTVTTDTRKEVLIGVSTLFTTELQEGDWIWDATNNGDEVRKIVNIVSATELRVEPAFTNAISADAIKLVARDQYSMISFQAEGDWNLDGVAQKNLGEVTLKRDFGSKRPTPVVVEPNTENVRIMVMK